MIEIKGLNKTFGNNQVLKDINLKISKGEKIVIIGPSGSRKVNIVKMHQFIRGYNFRKNNI